MAAAGVRDNSVRSVLLFSGDREVHGLFDFVMAEALGAAAGAASGAAELAADVPVILAPVPFEGSTLKLPQIKVGGNGVPVAGLPGGAPAVGGVGTGDVRRGGGASGSCDDHHPRYPPTPA